MQVEGHGACGIGFGFQNVAPSCITEGCRAAGGQSAHCGFVAEECQSAFVFTDCLNAGKVVRFKYKLLDASILVDIIYIYRLHIKFLGIERHLRARFEHVALRRAVGKLDNEHVEVFCVRRHASGKARHGPKGKPLQACSGCCAENRFFLFHIV